MGRTLDYLYFSDVAVNDNATWTDGANVVGSFRNGEASFAIDGAGNYYGGGAVDNTTLTPDDITSLTITYYDDGDNYVDDVVTFEVYDPRTTTWRTLTTLTPEIPSYRFYEFHPINLK